jgi:hypothetical protein
LFGKQLVERFFDGRIGSSSATSSTFRRWIGVVAGAEAAILRAKRAHHGYARQG